jgi:hypothetical protein
LAVCQTRSFQQTIAFTDSRGERSDTLRVAKPAWLKAKTGS